MSRRLPENLAQGQAGVYRVASELLMRGHAVYFPAVDIGADLTLHCGLKIQVKSAHLSVRSPYPKGAYWFKLGKMTIQQRRQTWVAHNLSEDADIVIFWGIEGNKFWIVPTSELDGHQLVTLGPVVSYRSIDMRELCQLRDAGKTQEEIAEVLGVSATTVARRLEGLHASPKQTLCSQVRAREGQWELIDSYVDMLREAKGTLAISEEIEQCQPTE